MTKFVPVPGTFYFMRYLCLEWWSKCYQYNNRITFSVFKLKNTVVVLAYSKPLYDKDRIFTITNLFKNLRMFNFCEI